MLRRIDSRLDGIQEQMSQTRMELAAIGQQLAGLTTAVYAKSDRLDDTERRLKLIERRLELVDDGET